MPTLREQYDDLRAKALAIPDAAKADGRDTLNEDEMAQVAVVLKEAQDVAAKIREADESTALLKQITDLPEFGAAAAAATAAAGGGAGAPGTAAAALAAAGRKTLGDMFVESEAYKALKAKHPNGFPERAPVQMDPVQLGGWARASHGQKDLVFVGDNTNTGSQIPAVQPDYRGIILPTFGPLNVRGLFGSGTTQSDTIEYTREVRSARDNAAAPVPEAKQSAKTGDEASVKPESTFKYERATTNVKTIAHHIPVTRKALADVGQVRTLIDTFLRRGLDEELEHQLVNGDGTGENLLGIGNDPDIESIPFTTDVFTTVRKAKTALMIDGVQPNGILLNPEDDEAIDLTRDGNDRFFGNGPFGVGPTSLWALPRVWTNELPVGSAYVGDFSTAVVYDREAATITTGTIDDQFIRNMLTVLAEMRVGFAVWEPFKIRHVDLGSASS